MPIINQTELICANLTTLMLGGYWVVALLVVRVNN